MKVLSLYCGAGGIDEGLRQAGIKTTLAIDHEQDCCKSIKLNHPDTETICGKVSDYIDSLKGFDVIVGGPPCPEFSRANNNRSFDMCEVNNFWQIVENNKPKYFLMENVQDVKKKLYKTSYLVNCADYGVPQTRLRRFFTNLPLPIPTHAEKPITNFYGNTLKKWVSVKEALGIDGLLQERNQHFDRKVPNLSVNEPSPTVMCDFRLWISVDGYSKCNQIEKTRSIDEPAQTILASRDLQITNYQIYSLKSLEERNPTMFGKHKTQELDYPANTITAKDRGLVGDGVVTDGVVTDGEYARKLTNEELAILQGFPKEYKFYGGKGSVRRQIGNAVPSGVIKAFFSQITVTCK